YGVFSTFGIVVSLFIAQNTHEEQLAFFGQEVTTNFAWVILGAASCGFIVALVLLMPGRIAASFHIWSLHREARDFEEHLALQGEELAVREERREQLLDRHEGLLEGQERLLGAYQRVMDELDQVMGERDQLATQLAVSAVGSGQPAARVPPPTPPVAVLE